MKNTKLKKEMLTSRFVYFAGLDGAESHEAEAPKVEAGKKDGETPKGPEDLAAEAKARAGKMVGAGMEKPQELADHEFDKAMTDAEVKEKSKGYPKVTIDAKTQPIVDKLRGQIETAIKEKKLDNPKLHRGSSSIVDTDLTDNYEYVLVIDATKTPPNLLFKSPKKIEAGKEPIKLDETVGTLLNKPYQKIDVATNQTIVNKLKPKVKSHGDYADYYETKAGETEETGYVLVKDDTAGGLALYKGKPKAA